MEESHPEEQSAHIAATARRARVEINPAELRIKFNPNVLPRLGKIIEAVRSKEHAAPRRLIENLGKLASGNTTVIDGLRFMAEITQQMEEYSKNSGDYLTKMSWGTFVGGLYRHHHKHVQPMTLVVKERGRG